VLTDIPWRGQILNREQSLVSSAETSQALSAQRGVEVQDEIESKTSKQFISLFWFKVLQTGAFNTGFQLV
jgi:hypothetical protein